MKQVKQMIKRITFVLLSILCTNGFFAFAVQHSETGQTQEIPPTYPTPNSQLKKELETELEKIEEKTKKNQFRADLSASAALALKGIATGLELHGLGAYTILPLLGILGGAGGEYIFEKSAVINEKRTNRFRAALAHLSELKEDFLDSKDKNQELKTILSEKKSCKTSCSSNMGKKNANNFKEIAWCILNCPNLILRDYVCEVFGNMKDTEETKSSILSRIKSVVKDLKPYLPVSNNKQDSVPNTKFLATTDLIPLISKFFADPFTQKYRQYIKGKMLNSYYQSAFQFSVVQLAQFTTMAHKLEHAEFWSPDSNPDLGSLVNSTFRKNSPMIKEIKDCFGSLCYTTYDENKIEKTRTLTPGYYEKLVQSSKVSDGKILSALRNRIFIPQSGLISLEELNKHFQGANSEEHNPADTQNNDLAIMKDSHPTGTDMKQAPAPFSNYCDYYFARTPINFHSRITNTASNIKNLGEGKKYQDYFDAKVQERYDMIKRSREYIKEFLVKFDESIKNPDTTLLAETTTELEKFMEEFSQFMNLVQEKKHDEIKKWKVSNPDSYKQIMKVIASHKANQQELSSN